VLNLDPAKLLVIAVVAVILLGPDKLPQVARQVGAAWRSFNEFRHRMESEVRNSIPDLPSSADIARLARSPSALLNHLSTMAPPEGSENGVADGGAVGPADGVSRNGTSGVTSGVTSHGTSAGPPGAESHGEQQAPPTPTVPTPTMPTPTMPSPTMPTSVTPTPRPTGVPAAPGVVGDPSLN
jgi:TatA/E family protein of Tat protein translocase